MSFSVDEIQSRIASYVDQDPVTTNISSTDYALRLKYINMSLTEWQESYDWQSLYKEYNMLVSTATGNASIALPSDYRKLASVPQITWDGATTTKFPDVRPQESGRYADTDRYISILGNPRSTYTMFVHGVTLTSGASVKIPYYASAQSLASPANVPDIPNPQYLVTRTIAYLLEAREDARFPGVKQEAERILGTMIDYENTFGEGASWDRVRTVEETKWGDFRMGEGDR